MNGAKSGLLAVSVLTAALVGCGPEDGYPEEADASSQFSTVEQALGNSCNNLEITVFNSRERNGVQTTIKVDHVMAYSASEGAWLNEDLADTMINHGSSYTWYNQDLAQAENDLLTRWRVYYWYLQADGTWSSKVYQEIDTVDDKCLADDNYSLTVQ